jgi:putative flippase GtrA
LRITGMSGNVWRRWARFNGVGVLGIVLQLTVLWVLVRFAPIHYLLSTALAVEAAVLHNFLWHQRWTWRDRVDGSTRGLLKRLWRFHAVNGAVSLVGNIVLMRAFSGGLGLQPLEANGVAILLCSLANFVGSEWLVFRSGANAEAPAARGLAK